MAPHDAQSRCSNCVRLTKDFIFRSARYNTDTDRPSGAAKVVDTMIPIPAASSPQAPVPNPGEETGRLHPPFYKAPPTAPDVFRKYQGKETDPDHVHRSSEGRVSHLASCTVYAKKYSGSATTILPLSFSERSAMVTHCWLSFSVNKR